MSGSSIQPKFKLNLAELDNNVVLSELVSHIILGPTASSNLQRRTVERLLDHNDKESLKEKLYSSTIPYRP